MSKPDSTCLASMNRDFGTRRAWFATRTVRICTRSAARNKISLICTGHASASSQTTMAQYDRARNSLPDGVPSLGGGDGPPVTLLGDQTADDPADDLQPVSHDVQSGLSERSRASEPHEVEEKDAERPDQHAMQDEG
jgi:hypothetical protein